MSRQVKKEIVGVVRSDSDQPIYKQLVCLLEAMIAESYPAGCYLPSENELAMHFGVNRHTVRRAIDDLVTAGFVLRQQGKGCLVINQHIHYALSKGRFTRTVDQLGHSTKTDIIKCESVKCHQKIAKSLGINTSDTHGNRVYLIQTLRWVDGEPMTLISHFLNPHYVPDIEHCYKGGSLHDCIEKNYQLFLRRTNAFISAVMPSNDDALFLKCALNQPLLRVKSFNSMTSSPEKIVEVSISLNRSDRFQITV
ncbi:GntR family transcriptional regulator [Eionea flava]